MAVCLRLLLPVLLAALLVPSWGCTAADQADADPEEPLPPSHAPVVFAHAVKRKNQQEDVRDRRRLKDDEAGWKEKLSLAQRYASGGFDEQALQILDTALDHDPPQQWSARMRGLKSSLLARRASEVLMRVSARARRDYVPFNTPVDFVIRFRNVSSKVVTLLAPEEGAVSSPSAVTLEITRRDRDIYASEMRRSWNQTVFIHKPGDPPVKIPPGGTWDFAVRFPAEEVGAPVAGLRVIEVGGTMRPTRLQKGNAWRTVRLQVRPGRVVALPNGYESLVDRPLHSMRTAVETVAPIHLLVATEFVAPGRRVDAVEILAGALAEGHPSLRRAALGGLSLLRERAIGEPLAQYVEPLMDALVRAPGRSSAVMEALSTVTGVTLAPDARLWHDWWRRERGKRTTIASTDPEST